MFKGHVVLRLKTNAGAEDVGKSSTLLGECVDHGRTTGSEGSLEHVAEDAEHAVEAGVVSGAAISTVSLPLNTSHHFSDEHQVNDQGRSKKGVLADVEQTDGLVPIQEDFGVVLVKSTLVVANSRHILDDNAVIRVLAFLVQDIIGSNHVVNNVGLRDLLGTELFLRAEVHAVVVAKMVVAGNGGELDASVDQEVYESRLHLGLTRLEIVTTNEGAVLLGKLNSTWNEGVLRGTVDEWCVLEDGSDSEDSRGSDFLVTGFDRLHKIVSGVVDALQNISITLRVGSPLHDDLVEAVGSLEVASLR